MTPQHDDSLRCRPSRGALRSAEVILALVIPALIAPLGCGTFGGGKAAPVIEANAPAPTPDSIPAADALARTTTSWWDSLAAPELPVERSAWLAAHPDIRELEELFRQAVALTARNMLDPAEDLLDEVKDKAEAPAAAPQDSLAQAYRQSLNRRLTLLAGLLAEERVVLGRSVPPDSVLDAVYADLRGLVFPDTLAPITPEARRAIETELLDVDNPLVQEWLSYFTGPGRTYFARWLERKASTDSLIVGILKDSGLPPELFYLSVIESGLSSRARSRVGAVGYWQFMPGTAQHFALRRDWWVDERRDLEMSTRAAATYLSQLYNHFQNWPLVLAAYNAGEGRIDRIIRRVGHEDFWRLPLPQQTRNHIPKFIAAARIFADPASYGFEPPEPAPLRYDVVKMDAPTDLDIIARCAGVGSEDVRELNPALLRGVSPPDAKSYPVRVPAGRGEICQRELSRLPVDQRVTWRQHGVQKGETLGGIARKYGVSVAMLKQTNKMGKSNLIHPGDRLLIPVGGGAAARRAPAEREPAQQQVAAASSAAGGVYAPPDGYKKVTYSVRRGDTLARIAKKLGVTLEHLLQVNNLAKRSLLRPGQRLIAWLPASAAGQLSDAG